MKRMLCVLAALLLLALPSCGKPEEPELAADAPSAEGVGSASEEAKSGGFDVDLTLMSSTMVYSEVYNMMAMPDDYVGKTVRMKGTFAAYPGEDRNYYVCFIADAAACCQQGMEFVLDGEYVYPDDYPAEGTEITVSGVFDTYYEGEYMRYCQLIDARMTY
ncbi:MAG: hypothetical protein II768_05065 [Clostridia bacterium]|nr:hypothetical protein [Clostridia bacterium]